jgi:hypothetical protein
MIGNPNKMSSGNGLGSPSAMRKMAADLTWCLPPCSTTMIEEMSSGDRPRFVEQPCGRKTLRVQVQDFRQVKAADSRVTQTIYRFGK